MRGRKAMSEAMTTVVGLMAIAITFIFFFQTLIIGVKADVVTQSTDTIANIVSVQGGILNSAPYGYPGGNENYISANELNEALKDVFDGGVDYENDVKIEVNGIVVKNFGEAGISRPTSTYDKGSLIKVETSVEYDWGSASGFKSKENGEELSGKRVINANRTSISEYKYHYSSWDGDR